MKAEETITLRIAYDPKRELPPSSWDWATLIDALPDAVSVFEYRDMPAIGPDTDTQLQRRASAGGEGMNGIVEDIEQLAQVPANAVLVDRIGVAYQVERPGWLLQAGDHRRFEAVRFAEVMPMRIVDDGSAAQTA